MAQTSSSGAVFLVELSLAQRAARDARWDAAAIEAGGAESWAPTHVRQLLLVQLVLVHAFLHRAA
jgi:hypothetical protein